MDLITHAALGAAGAVAIAPARTVRVAALAGAVAGLLPDADQLIASAADPLLTLEFHRHFTHSLLMVPVGALLVSALLWWSVRERLAFGQFYAYAFIGYLLSPLLDACTSYGTHLAWPFAARPVALSIIPIVEPVLTLSIVVALIFALVRLQPVPARIGCAIVALVLAAGFVQHQRALSLARDLAQARSHAPERLMVKPTLGNLLLWRSVYVVDGRIHVDGIRVGLPATTLVYPGENAPRFDPKRDIELPSGSRLRKDVDRFVAFTDGLPVRHPSRPEFIGDARYAMLPTSIEPLWGIVLDPAAPDAHARFETNRKLTPAIRQRFIDMLLGREHARMR